jgi:hypothetical protein
MTPNQPDPPYSLADDIVEEERGVDAVAAEFLDVRRDGVEDGGCGRRGREAEGDAELAVEVAAPEGHVVAVGQAVAALGDALAEGAEDAGLADAGIADENDGLVAGHGVAELETCVERRARALFVSTWWPVALSGIPCPPETLRG